MESTSLTSAETAVLLLIAEGLSDQEIAVALCKSLYTIRTHRDHLLRKTDCHNRVGLTRWAINAGYVAARWDLPPTPDARENTADAG